MSAILGGATLVAMFFPTILNIFAIAGGLFGVTQAVTFPGLIYIKLGSSSWKSGTNICIIFVVIVFTLFGLFGSVISFLKGINAITVPCTA